MRSLMVPCGTNSKALGPVGFQKGAVVARARIGADHLAHAPGIDQPGQAVIAVAGVVGDDGQLAGAVFVKCIEQMVGDPDGAKSCHQYRRSIPNPGYGVGGGLDPLVDHVKGLLLGGIVVWCPWLMPGSTGRE